MGMWKKRRIDISLIERIVRFIMAERRVCFSVGDEFVGRIDRWNDHDLNTLYERILQIKAQASHAVDIIEAEMRVRLPGPAIAGELATQLSEPWPDEPEERVLSIID